MMKYKNMSSNTQSIKIANEWFTFQPGEVKELVNNPKNLHLNEWLVTNNEDLTFDINNDGVVDDEDVSLAAKVLVASRKPRKPRKKKSTVKKGIIKRLLNK